VDGFVVHEVAADVVVRIGRTMPELPPDTELAVEQLWQTASQRAAAGGAGLLFNGLVFSADSITRHLVTGDLTEFRRGVAQIENPELFAVLGVRPPAVCGVLRCADGVVAGRRHRARSTSPAWWGRWDSSTALPHGGCSLPACVTVRPGASRCAAGRMDTGPSIGKPTLP
jgi:hypothetical protein